MRLLVFGAGGQLGQALVHTLEASHEVTGFTRAQVDVCDRSQVHSAVARLHPDVVINAAAMTDVDGCERDPGQAYRVNALAVRWMVEAADDIHATLAHVSTDFIFSGEERTGYTEWDLPGPIQTYGASKLAGETEAATARRHLVIRTSWLYGGPERGFVQAILRRASEGHDLDVVIDQVGSPSYTGDVADMARLLLEEGVTGAVHVANAGSVSRYDFAREIVRLAGLHVAVRPLDAPPASVLAARPRNTSLQTAVLTALGRSMPRWQEGLRTFFGEVG